MSLEDLVVQIRLRKRKGPWRFFILTRVQICGKAQFHPISVLAPHRPCWIMASESDYDESSASEAEDLNTTRSCLGRPELLRSVTKLPSAISRPDMIASEICRLDTMLGLASNDGHVDPGSPAFNFNI
jgi:hypothetical protein